MSYGDVQLKRSPVAGPGTSPVDATDATPDDFGAGGAANTPLGITAGTTNTGFDPDVIDHDTTGPSLPLEPNADEWRQIGMTSKDVAYLRSVGIQGNDLRSFYQSAASQLNLAANPGPVTGADPLAGTPLAGAGLTYDSQSGLAVDPKTGNIYDPNTGSQLDPNTGQPITTADGSAPAQAPGVGDATPGWSAAYNTKFAKAFADAGAPPEVAQVLIDGLKNSTPPLNKEQLDAGLQFYTSAQGKAQIAQMVSQYGSGKVPLTAIAKTFAPYVAAAVGLAGAGVYAVNKGRHSLADRSVELARKAAGGEGVSAKDQAAAEAKIAAGGSTGRKAAAILGTPNQALQDRGRVGLQLAMQRSDKLPAGETGTISPTVDKLLEGTVPSDELKDLAADFKVPLIEGESPSSLANRIAQQQGVGITDAGAKSFLEPGARNGNSGGGASFRTYTPPENVHVGSEWASNRAAADSLGVGLLHPLEKFRLASAATAQGPEFTRMAEIAADGGGKGAQILGGINAGIAARGTEGTLASGLEGITKDGLGTLKGKGGALMAVVGAATEVRGVAKVVSKFGIDSKESGNAIGGATGRVAGNFAGFAIGQSVGTTVGVVAGEAGATLLTSVLTGAGIGTAIPIPGVGTAVGAIVGLGVGLVAGNYAGKYLGKVGEHVGSALSWVNKETGIGTVLGGINNVSKKMDNVMDGTAKKVDDAADKVLPSFTHGPVHVAVKAQEEVVKAAVNPLGFAKDAGHAASSAWHGIKSLF